MFVSSYLCILLTDSLSGSLSELNDSDHTESFRNIAKKKAIFIRKGKKIKERINVYQVSKKNLSFTAKKQFFSFLITFFRFFILCGTISKKYKAF